MFFYWSSAPHGGALATSQDLLSLLAIPSFLGDFLTFLKVFVESPENLDFSALGGPSGVAPGVV